MLFCADYISPIGKILLMGDNANLTGLWLEMQKCYPFFHETGVPKKEDLPAFKYTKQWLDAYFSGKNPSISALSLAPQGSAFQQRVWQILRQIPYGEILTYGDIANIIAAEDGRKMSAQAVGGAVGHNPISIIIPCHRVVGSSGNLTGYAGGLDIKLKLLKLEGVDVARLKLA